MTRVEPIHCRPAAFELMAAQSRRLGRADALLAGAVAIAMHEMPAVDLDGVGAHFDQLAADIGARYRSRSERAALAHAHRVLFDERGLRGVIGDAVSLDSYPSAVLDRGRGTATALALAYKFVLGRLGLVVHGLDVPGRFLAGVELDDSVMFVDIATLGRVVSVSDLAEFLPRRSPGSGELRDLPVVSNRQWLGRLLSEAGDAFEAAGRPVDQAAMGELGGLLDAHAE